MRRRAILLAAFLALVGCSSGPTRLDSLPRSPSEGACWGGYSARGERTGPFQCSGDGVTPIYSEPIGRRTPAAVEVPCPPGHRGPCSMTGGP